MPIVAAVGVAVPNRSASAVRIEAAMMKALKDAQKEGVTDPVVLKRRMTQAAEREKAR